MKTFFSLVGQQGRLIKVIGLELEEDEVDVVKYEEAVYGTQSGTFLAA